MRASPKKYGSGETEITALDKGSRHIIAYDLDADQAAEISSMDEIERAGFSTHIGYAELPQSANPDTPYLEIKAYTADTFEMMNITLAEGRLPENEHEIVISETALEDGADIKIGDRISGGLFGMTITGTDPKLSGTAFPAFGIELHYGETIETPIGLPFMVRPRAFGRTRYLTAGRAITPWSASSTGRILKA